MKKLSFFHSLMAVLMMTAAFTACSEDDDNGSSDSTKGAHYDLTITVGKHGGMAKSETHVTLSVASLNNPDSTITFDGKGVEITDYTIESIYDKTLIRINRGHDYACTQQAVKATSERGIHGSFHHAGKVQR